ncbi:unnamed protein product [Amoebophrya sp. A25]|nr:unnamed protein product [Amoebophrya sp. A25]CAD7939343.1 unnamed protein product [Amoebophrya sp. A25]|eukprot:GSA25T00006395001.1
MIARQKTLSGDLDTHNNGENKRRMNAVEHEVSHAK